MEFRKVKTIVLFALLTVVIWGVMTLTFLFAPPYSAFAAALFKVVLALDVLVAIDVVLTRINILDELKKGNVAVAVAVLGYCVLVGFCISTA